MAGSYPDPTITHKYDDINPWLANDPRITLRVTPNSGSWLNLVDVFFGTITGRAIRRGSRDSVTPLVATIRAFVDGDNRRVKPLVWTKTPEQISPRATRQPPSDADHLPPGRRVRVPESTPAPGRRRTRVTAPTNVGSHGRTRQ